MLEPIGSAEVARSIVRARLEPAYARASFTPPSPTWPVADDAFDSAVNETPRDVLLGVHEHIKRCIRRNHVEELHELQRGASAGQSEVRGPPPPPPEVFAAIDSRFREIYGDVNVHRVLHPKFVDDELPPLLHAALQAVRIESGNESLTVGELQTGKASALHGRLHQELDPELERQQVWSFRAIPHKNAAAVLPRLRSSARESRIQESRERHLVLMRTDEWPGLPGTQTHGLLGQLRTMGVPTVPLQREDLARFAALRTLSNERPEHFEAWLVERKPALGSSFFSRVFELLPMAEVSETSAPVQPSAPPAPPAPSAPPASAEPVVDEPTGPRMMLGARFEDRVMVSVPLEVLRKHTVVFAGSGSGKTVMIRRMIEEAALQGVSSIVLDPNNDLARLGDAWPEQPAAWGPGDAQRASVYLESTEVVVYTPRRESGRPLTFRPLPDFGQIRGDSESVAMAVDVAVASLASLAHVEGGTARAAQCRAVLKSALQKFATGTHDSGLEGFIELLREPPDRLAGLAKAVEYAKAMAESLQAARVNDPLLGGHGEPADPGALLTPSAGKKARISVISFIGLPDDRMRQSFVNQLQMALFSWARENPAGDRPLGGLFVMDEAQNFAPSSGTTACTKSTLLLASQARKYGLGLIFATQAPKNLHNNIPGNATTQFYGRLQSPTQIAAVKEVAQSKGGRVDGIGQFEAGEFYAVSESVPLQKVKTRMCLSHHPSSPLDDDEVIQRAQRTQSKP